MTKCSSCVFNHCACLDAVNDNYPRVVVTLPNKGRYRDKQFIRLIARGVSSLDIPRRKIPEQIAVTLMDFQGILMLENGRFFDIEKAPDDDVFGSDPSFRCIDDITRLAEIVPANDPSPRMQSRYLLIAIFLRIRRPDLLPLPIDAVGVARYITLNEARKCA